MCCFCLNIYIDTINEDLTLCKFAHMPLGGSLVILIADSRMPCGIIWYAASAAGSALKNNLSKEKNTVLKTN